MTPATDLPIDPPTRNPSGPVKCDLLIIGGGPAGATGNHACACEATHGGNHLSVGGAARNRATNIRPGSENMTSG